MENEGRTLEAAIWIAIVCAAVAVLISGSLLVHEQNARAVQMAMLVQPGA